MKDQKSVPVPSTSRRGIIHPGGLSCYHTCILTFKRPGLHGCVGFNSGSEPHIFMQQGWLSALLLTCTTSGCTLDRTLGCTQSLVLLLLYFLFTSASSRPWFIHVSFRNASTSTYGRYAAFILSAE